MTVKIEPVKYLSDEDSDELRRLLMAFADGDEQAAADWLTKADIYDLGGKPIDLIKRDELGVVRVLDYLRDAS